jgi:hypothetical protein
MSRSIQLAIGLGLAILAIVAGAGCSSPEDGRVRGGGHGGDGGNYQPGAIHVPSKIDGTRTWTSRPKV